MDYSLIFRVTVLALILVTITLAAYIVLTTFWEHTSHMHVFHQELRGAKAEPVLKWKRAISYAYVDNAECAANLAYFMNYGRWDLWNSSTLFVLVVNGYASSIDLPDHPSFAIVRRENVGFDFGAHVSGLQKIEALAAEAGSPPPEEYGFMNCGVTGPFLPAYATDFDWFGAYSSRLSKSVRLVGTYITCLHPDDLGGVGPRVEGHSFFTDRQGVTLLRVTGVLKVHETKLKAIIDGEWSMTRVVFAAGFTIDTLLFKYQGVDWTDPDNFSCNNNRFVGRAGDYGGFTINPFETIFFKRLWKTVDLPSRAVRWEETARFMKWREQWALGLGAREDNDEFFPPPPPFVDDNIVQDILARRKGQ
jgi:hypothetical protein